MRSSSAEARCAERAARCSHGAARRAQAASFHDSGATPTPPHAAMASQYMARAARGAQAIIRAGAARRYFARRYALPIVGRHVSARPPAICPRRHRHLRESSPAARHHADAPFHGESAVSARRRCSAAPLRQNAPASAPCDAGDGALMGDGYAAAISARWAPINKSSVARGARCRCRRATSASTDRDGRHRPARRRASASRAGVMGAQRACAGRRRYDFAPPRWPASAAAMKADYHDRCRREVAELSAMSSVTMAEDIAADDR